MKPHSSQTGPSSAGVVYDLISSPAKTDIPKPVPVYNGVHTYGGGFTIRGGLNPYMMPKP